MPANGGATNAEWTSCTHQQPGTPGVTPNHHDQITLIMTKMNVSIAF